LLVPIRGVGDARMLLVSVDSITALDSFRLGIVRGKRVGSWVLVAIDVCVRFMSISVVLVIDRREKTRYELADMGSSCSGMIHSCSLSASLASHFKFLQSRIFYFVKI
jgi:hypothetical protein